MAKKKKSAIRADPGPKDADPRPEDADPRPESSPYAASIIDLRLKDATVLRIPSLLLRKCPRLPDPCPWSQTISLDITREVGHVLVHYLFTDSYQSLRPKGLSFYEKVAAEFRTSIQVYVLAREYQLSSLEELAKLEIGRLGNGLRFPTVLDLVRDAYPNPGTDDTWFSSYLKSGLESLLRNPSELSNCGMPNTKCKTLSVSDLLFKSLVELVRNHEMLPRGLDAAPQVEAPEAEAEPIEELVMEPEPGPEPVEEPVMDPEAEPEPVEEPAVDPEAEPEPVEEPAVEAEPEPENKEDGLGGPGASRKDKRKKEAQTFEPEPGKEDDWSLCESDGKETKTETVCKFRTEHVLGNGWEECCSCQDFIRQLSRRLP